MVTSITTTKRKLICLEECGALSKSALTRRNITEKEERAVLYLSRYKVERDYGISQLQGCSCSRLSNQTALIAHTIHPYCTYQRRNGKCCFLGTKVDTFLFIFPKSLAVLRRVGSPEQGHQGSERDVNKASENAERYALQAI